MLSLFYHKSFSLVPEMAKTLPESTPLTVLYIQTEILTGRTLPAGMAMNVSHGFCQSLLTFISFLIASDY